MSSIRHSANYSGKALISRKLINVPCTKFYLIGALIFASILGFGVLPVLVYAIYVAQRDN